LIFEYFGEIEICGYTGHYILEMTLKKSKYLGKLFNSAATEHYNKRKQI